MLVSFRSALLIFAAQAQARSLRPRLARLFRAADPGHDRVASEDRRARADSILRPTRRTLTSRPHRSLRRDGPKRRRRPSGEADRRSRLPGGAAPQLRCRQPRARMPRRRHLFRIEERAARRPARRRRSDRQPRQFERPLPVDLLRRAVPARPILLHSRPVAAVGAARPSRQWQTAVAIAKIVDQDLKDSAVGNALFFHAKHVSPGWRLKRVASIGNHVFYR